MDRISFSCPECGAKLAVGSALRGKSINCPKCQHKSQVPAFEVVDDPPPPPPPELLRFSCVRCDAKLRVSPELGGQRITCPKCNESTPVPDPKLGTFSLDEKTQPTGAAAPVEERPLAEWWPDSTKQNLPFSWQAPLSTAREHVERERWTKALGLLNELFQKGLSGKSKAGTHVLRKPLAFCLGRWAVRELDRLEEDGEQLSKPLRKVLKQAAVLRPAFAQFDLSLCPLCGHKFRGRNEGTKFKTVAGPVFLCCAKPTGSDNELIQTVDKINKKLTVGLSLDGENPEIPAALTRIPDWYRALDLNPHEDTSPVDDSAAGWGRITAAGDGRGGGGGGAGGGGGGVVVAGDGGFAGYAAGEFAGNACANIISGLLGG
jgi:DNA-directed RNA polymerase subunit RPC12/RpoP